MAELLLFSFLDKKRTATHDHPLYFLYYILHQRLYRVQGGNIIVELYLADGESVSVLSNMDGAYPFLDTAFAGWCKQTGRNPEECTFHDPSKHWWFPHEEEV